MIRQLTGTITHIENNALILNVNGVGYLIYTPTNTTIHTLHAKASIHTYLAVRETALDLYGFTTDVERRLFELLLSVSKIGPKSALAVMCQASPTLLIEQIAANEPAQLHKLSGVGKKTCENIVSHLHEKLGDLATHITPTGPIDAKQTDAIDALVALGYDAASAREIVQSLNTEENSVNDIITKALQKLP
jgi:Holliday junction DNA helicase RuvA